MNTHYIPRLLLRLFATGEHINTYNFSTHSLEYKKLKSTFSETDLFDEELEEQFNCKIEGPFGNLLNNKLLHFDEIKIDRQENLLLRMFLLINFLRAPIVNTDWDEMVKRTKLQNHPSVQAREFLLRHHPGLKGVFEEGMPSAANYITNLRKAMEVNSLEDLAEAKPENSISISLQFAARIAMVSVIAFWDTSGTDGEFILPKLPGITEMDNLSIFHKMQIIEERRRQLEEEWLPDDLVPELKRLRIGSLLFSENYKIYPISPNRCIACFSPYFRAFFPIKGAGPENITYPPLLKRDQFDHHFYKPMRMELFEPCKAKFNQFYTYQVKKLSNEELNRINSLMLDMETEEFAFHDINKISNSLRYYDNIAVFIDKKKHNFSKLYK